MRISDWSSDVCSYDLTLKGKRIRGKVQGTSFVPYDDRAAIEAGALAGRGLEIAWAADPVEFFFLQVQGSGRIRLPDGGIIRIGYDSQNGRDRSEEHTSELQSLMRISYAVFGLKKQKK